MQNLMVGVGWRAGRARRIVPILEKGKERFGEEQLLPQVPPKVLHLWDRQEVVVISEAVSSVCQSHGYSLKPDYSLRPQGAPCSPLGWGGTYK